MDLSSFTGGNVPKQKEEVSVPYTAQATSPLINGEVNLIISENSLRVSGLFTALEIAFCEINALKIADYTITVITDHGDYLFAKMGSWCQPFYDALCTAYNQAVLRSLFVKDTPLMTAKGLYSYNENGHTGSNTALVQVHENSVVALPHDLGARRIPLCFTSGLDKDQYKLILQLATSEKYTFAKLGYDAAFFANTIEKQMRLLREKTLVAIKGFDPSLTTVQAAQIAELMPQGVAVSMEQLLNIAPSFANAIETKLANTSAAESYRIFKELGDFRQIWVGFRQNENIFNNVNVAQEEALPPDPYLFWLIVPSPNRQYAAVEFAEANTATFVYRTDGDFNGFARQLNRALEAINFKREVIRFSDEELRKAENADYYMAAKRTVALQFVRAKFVGRVIHTNIEVWKRKLMELWGKA